MIRRFNFFVNRVMPRAVGYRKILTPEVMRHYRRALPDWGSRYVAPTSLDTLSALQIGCTPFGATEKLL